MINELQKYKDEIKDISQDIGLYEWDMEKHKNNTDCMEYQSAKKHLEKTNKKISGLLDKIVKVRTQRERRKIH